MNQLHLALALVLGVTASASANDDLEHAIAAFNEADFDGALAAFARAEASERLTREELTELLARRAGVHVALGNDEATRTDLATLAALEPNFVFGAWAPPQLRERFEQSRGEATRPTLAVTTHEGSDGRVFEASVDGAPDGLVRDTRIYVREPGALEWSSIGSGETADGEVLEYYAEAIGLGGVVVARVASREQPRRVGELAAPTVEDGGSRSWRWWVIGGAAALAIGVVVGVAVAASGGDGSTTIERPVFTFE